MDESAAKIKELKAEIKRLKKAAQTDELTGILNRRGLLDQLRPLVAEVRYSLDHAERRQGLDIKQLAFVMIDLDHFKPVNDKYGHLAGDIILRQFAELLRSSARGMDLVARYGGEEFCLVLVGTTAEAARLRVEKFRHLLENHSFDIRATTLTQTASFGISEVGAHIGGVAALIEAADKALYRAKHTGRNHIVVAGGIE